MAERAKKMRDLGNAMRFDAAIAIVGTCDNVVGAAHEKRTKTVVPQLSR